MVGGEIWRERERERDGRREGRRGRRGRKTSAGAHTLDVHYSIFGLGDTSYERFCYAGKMLARRMDSLGAHALTEPGWGDERAPDG